MKHFRDTIFGLCLILADQLVLNLSIWSAFYLRYEIKWFANATGPPAWKYLLSFILLTHQLSLICVAIAGGYRLPREWKLYQAFTLALRTLTLQIPATILITFIWRAAGHNEMLYVSRLLSLFIWSGFFLGLMMVRSIANKALHGLFLRRILVRRSLVYGDLKSASYVADLIHKNPWLGERVIDIITPEERSYLFLNFERDLFDIVWLAPSAGIESSSWLPEFLYDPRAKHVIWRMLPGQFNQFIQMSLNEVAYQSKTIFFERIRHHIALPTLKVAMLGSRGIPAGYSGIETYIEHVGKWLVNQGAQVTVYCQARYVSARGIYHGIDLITIPTIPTRHLETIVHTFFSTIHALYGEAEIFHYHALGPSTLAWLPRLLGRKVIVTVQGLDWARAKWGPVARLYLKLGEWTSIHFPHQSIVVSRALESYYAKKYLKPVRYIPNGFQQPVKRAANLIKTFGLESGNFILFVGRLVPEKGAHLLLHAFSQVETQKSLVLAGQATRSDEYILRLRKQVAESDRVKMIGFIKGEALEELYSNAYLVVHPSELEGLSIALLEALSYGNCVVVSDRPENLEAIQDLGYVFHSGDAQDLARQFQHLLDHPEDVSLMQERVTAEFDRHDWNWVAEHTYQEYQNLLN